MSAHVGRCGEDKKTSGKRKCCIRLQGEWIRFRGTEVHRGWKYLDCVKRLQGLWADNKLGTHLEFKAITVKVKEARFFRNVRTNI
jgi:hypothetical protein